MENLEINKEGLIVSGEHCGWTILIEQEDPKDKEYIVYIWSPDGSEGYDDWCEDKEWLENLFRDNKWKVKWEEKSK